MSGPQDLGGIRSPALNLCIWERRLPDALRAACAAAATGEPFTRRRAVAGREPDLSVFVEALPEGPIRTLLLRDLKMLVAVHHDVTGAPQQEITFGVIRTDSCRRFHTDNVGIRLLCTYAGPGTEWVPDDVARREHLGCAAACGEKTGAPVLAPAEVRRLAAGDVGLFKGEAWPRGGAAIVHRSPPIEGSGERRLCLRIDALYRA